MQDRRTASKDRRRSTRPGPDSPGRREVDRLEADLLALQAQLREAQDHLARVSAEESTAFYRWQLAQPLLNETRQLFRFQNLQRDPILPKARELLERLELLLDRAREEATV